MEGAVGGEASLEGDNLFVAVAVRGCTIVHELARSQTPLRVAGTMLQLASSGRRLRIEVWGGSGSRG